MPACLTAALSCHAVPALCGWQVVVTEMTDQSADIAMHADARALVSAEALRGAHSSSASGDGGGGDGHDGDDGTRPRPQAQAELVAGEDVQVQAQPVMCLISNDMGFDPMLQVSMAAAQPCRCLHSPGGEGGKGGGEGVTRSELAAGMADHACMHADVPTCLGQSAASRQVASSCTHVACLAW